MREMAVSWNAPLTYDGLFLLSQAIEGLLSILNACVTYIFAVEIHVSDTASCNENPSCYFCDSTHLLLQIIPLEIRRWQRLGYVLCWINSLKTFAVGCHTFTRYPTIPSVVLQVGEV